MFRAGRNYGRKEFHRQQHQQPTLAVFLKLSFQELAWGASNPKMGPIGSTGECERSLALVTNLPINS